MTGSRDYSPLLAELAEAYAQYSPRSAALHDQALEVLVDGGSHALRLIQPFPPRIVAARGARVRDEDGHSILDFWQGHFANLLGHNPDIVLSALAQAFEDGFGLQTGFSDRLQVEVAELLCRQTGAERVRFTTSGSLATLYAVILASAFTGRHLVMKVGGGWHGAQPWGLRGVRFDPQTGYSGLNTEGLSPALAEEVVVTGFNDPSRLADDFRRHGDQLACFMVEPVLGAGGLLPATGEYLHTARQLCSEYGAVLVFDEVVTGFRFRAGDLGRLYGVQPDLTTFGKIIGGGMPVSAVAGRADILGQVGCEQGRKVAFSGGTFSAHPASLLAAKTVMDYLVEREAEVYPRLASLGELARRTAEQAFGEEGIYAYCSGHSGDLACGSSMAMLHFPYQEGSELVTPDDANDPTKCDVELRDGVLQLALLLEDVHVVHGLAAVSTAHCEEDIVALGEACRSVARRVKSQDRLLRHT